MDYRAYILDDEGASRACMSWIAHDEEAKEKADQLIDGHDLDVWRRERHVMRLKRHTRQ